MVFRLHSSKTYPEKIKYHLILIEADGDVYFIFSNSNLLDYQKNNPNLRNLQIEVLGKEDSCFPNSCFIDCSRINSESIESLAAQIANNFASHLGEISKETRIKIKDAVAKDRKILSKIEN